MELTITAYKLPDGKWAFDHAHQNTVRELLCNGTEIVIDGYFLDLTGKLPTPGDKIGIRLIAVKARSKVITWKQQSQTTLFKLSGNKEGTTYRDSKTNMIVWLCPWLQGYFGFVPDRIGVSVFRI